MDTRLILLLPLALVACQGINEKAGQYDAAADRLVVENVDNSNVNRAINRGLDTAGEAVTAILPGAMRPPAQRLQTDESESAGETPEPEQTDIPVVAEPVVSTVGSPVDSVVDSTAQKSIQPASQAPLAEAVPAEPAVKLVEMTAAGVTLKRSNIRMGPGLDYDIVDTVAAGTPLSVSGRTANDWLLINRKGAAFGYVLSSLVRLAE